MVLKILFWILIACDLAAVGLLFLLGLAAAGPSHTSSLMVTALLLIIPGSLLAGSIALFVAAKSLLWRGVAFLVAAAPLLFAVFSVASAGINLSKYPPAKPGALGCEPLKAAWRGR